MSTTDCPTCTGHNRAGTSEKNPMIPTPQQLAEAHAKQASYEHDQDATHEDWVELHLHFIFKSLLSIADSLNQINTSQADIAANSQYAP